MYELTSALPCGGSKVIARDLGLGCCAECAVEWPDEEIGCAVETFSLTHAEELGALLAWRLVKRALEERDTADDQGTTVEALQAASGGLDQLLPPYLRGIR